MKRFLGILCAALMAFAPVSAQEINVTYVASPLNVPSIVEREKHFFDEYLNPLGVSVAYSELTTGPEQTQALASGDIQFLFAVGATSVILSAANGADISVISIYSRSPEAFCLFSSHDGIKEAADLRGKTVVGPVGTILHELLAAYLAEAGMKVEDVNFVDMTIPNAVAVLTGGSADAALLAGPAAYNMTAAGYQVVTTGKGLVDATIVVAAARSYCEEHPEIVDAFLQAQAKTLSFMSENPDTAMDITSARLDIPLESVKEMAEKYDFSMQIRQSDVESMENTMRFMLENGMIEQSVDIEGLLRK